MEALSQQEAFARIRLLRSPNVGPVSYSQLLRRFGTAEAALTAQGFKVERIDDTTQPNTPADQILAQRLFGALPQYGKNLRRDFHGAEVALHGMQPHRTRTRHEFIRRPARPRFLSGAAHKTFNRNHGVERIRR